MTTPPPGWYPSPDAAGMHRWWDGQQWTAHVRPTMSDAPAPTPRSAPETVRALPSEYAAAFEATAALQQRGGLAGAIGGLGQQYLSTALAQATPTRPPQPGAGTFVPQPHAAAETAGTPQPYGSVAPEPQNLPGLQPYGSAGTQPYGSAGTQPYGSAGTQPYGSAGPQPYGSAGPQPYAQGGVQPYGSGAAYPYGSGVPTFANPGHVQGAAEVFGGIVGDRRGGGIGNGLKQIFIGFVFALSAFFVIPQITSAHAGAGETSTSGTVVSLHESTGSKGSRLCSPEATFVADGVTFRAQAGYSSSSCPSIGSSITVIYPTADPTDARIPTSAGFLLLLGIFPVVGVALLVFGIRSLVVGSSSIGSGLRRLRG